MRGEQRADPLCPALGFKNPAVLVEWNRTDLRPRRKSLMLPIPGTSPGSEPGSCLLQETKWRGQPYLPEKEKAAQPFCGSQPFCTPWSQYRNVKWHQLLQRPSLSQLHKPQGSFSVLLCHLAIRGLLISSQAGDTGELESGDTNHGDPG